MCCKAVPRDHTLLLLMFCEIIEPERNSIVSHHLTPSLLVLLHCLTVCAISHTHCMLLYRLAGAYSKEQLERSVVAADLLS